VCVSEIAESQNHHPEFLSTYTKVQIRLVTHDADGLTHKDFELALAIDQLVQRDF
jgi:4a-hydroxytetrahydrobiopterin dehydratase